MALIHPGIRIRLFSRIFSLKGRAWLVALSPFVRQHETHRQLVGSGRPVVGLRVPPDAIIVPASRPAGNLSHAIALAQAVNCRLVVLCSREAKAAEVMEEAAAAAFRRPVAVDLPDDYDHELLRFTSSTLIRDVLAGYC